MIIDMTLVDNYRAIMDEQFYDGVAEFITDSKELLARVQTAMINGDIDDLHLASHSLKSSAEFLGAVKLSAQAHEVEIQCIAVKNKDMGFDDIDTRSITNLEQCFKDILPLYKDMLSQEARCA